MAKKKLPPLDFAGMTKEQAIEAIKERGFANVGKDDIKAYLVAFEAGQSREWLKKAYKAHKEVKLVDVLDENGNKVETGKKDKNGNPKYKKRREVVKGGTEKPRYSHNTAKKLFFERIGLETKAEKEEEEYNFEEEFKNFWG